jgi:hypothetical protein
MRVTFTSRSLSSRLRYIAVASPSRFGFVQRITSRMPSPSRRASSSRMRSCSGPTPSIGLIAPCSTWYRPLNSCVFSTAAMSRGSSTTHTTVASRRSSAQMPHSVASAPAADSAMLKQRRQNETRSLAAAIAPASRSASVDASLSRWKAMRCADLGPTPGNRPSSSMSSWTGSGYTPLTARHRADR